MLKGALPSVLAMGNLVLASANAIFAFSLLVYILAHNLRSSVARAFSALLTFIVIIYVGDILVANVVSAPLTLLWLRFQWLGIAFVPAACLHFSDALLRMTNDNSHLRRMWVPISYALGLVFFVLAAVTDLLVRSGPSAQVLAHLVPGPYFTGFALFFFATVLVAVINVFRARARCMTSTSRRRMTYLAVAIMAPAFGVFPFLLVTTAARALSPNSVLSLSLIGNLGIAIMTVISAYTVTYQGVLAPDRVVKTSLIDYLLRGPLVGSVVIFLMVVVPRVGTFLGLPRDTVLILAIIIGSVVLQVSISIARPYIDRLLYREDREEVNWIRQLDKHLLTSTDLAQLLENILVSLCELLRVRSGFVVAMEQSELKVQVFCGPREVVNQFLERCDWRELLASLGKDANMRESLRNDDFGRADGCWILPLRSRERESTLGILGFQSTADQPSLSLEELGIATELVRQVELALEDVQLQRDVFDALRRIVPEIQEIQRWRTAAPYSTRGLQHLEANPVYSPDFNQVVKEALRHYWGGPDLVNSPLMHTQVVQRAMSENDNIPARALRAVFESAIERLKPEGERSMTSNEWMIYNILELKFVQGKRIREITSRMALSESDFYRKQRVAIDQLAQVLAAMELELARG